MENENIVRQDAKIEAPSIDPKPEATAPAEPPKEVHTPANELYAALQQEREKRKALERELEEAKVRKEKVDEEIQHSEEGLVLKKDIERLEGVIGSLQEDRNLEKVLKRYPVLEEKLVEFDEYRQEYKDLPIDKVAMVFLAEQGALEKPPVRRIGLETPTGGPTEPPKTGLTVDDLKKLRTEDPKKYHKMLMKGQVKLADLKR